MHRRIQFLLLAVFIGTCAAPARTGDLAPPPGPIAATPGPEPRTPIGPDTTPGDADALFIISQPGSYYLADNITGVTSKHGIKIDADRVTLDLNGFSLIGVPGSLAGVRMNSARDNVVVCNGHVNGWGLGGLEVNIIAGRVERITASGNGAWGIDFMPGIATTFQSSIVSCEARMNGSLVQQSGGIRGGQVALIRDCIAAQNTGNGFETIGGANIHHCTAWNNSVDGIRVGSGSTVSDCLASLNFDDGIEVQSNSRVVNNHCEDNGFVDEDGANIHAVGSDNRIEGNTCVDGDRGIDVDGFGNFITRNTCAGNDVNYTIVTGNVCLVVQGVMGGAISGSSGGVSPGSTDPNANYSY